MKKSILITFVCSGLMLVTPLTGVAQENTVSNNLPEIPDDVEGLVAQLRVVIDEILEKYGHIPMVRSLCGAILNTLGLLGDLTICIIIIITALLTMPFIWYSYFIWSLFTLCVLVVDDYCPPYNNLISRIPFQSLYTMLETKDNINTFDGCPCLQE